eukprot:TRINITY_DN25065_c0_g1_i1.p1 TRINITY_DN25065_c0_g1~~TRINITY_DN25065_c0_g1_i1.p1  ORF type:complete len:620 (-),score=104.79 TRINITY_DN25065_c0_g1_i1:103-1962(-)
MASTSDKDTERMDAAFFEAVQQLVIAHELIVQQARATCQAGVEDDLAPDLRLVEETDEQSGTDVSKPIQQESSIENAFTGVSTGDDLDVLPSLGPVETEDSAEHRDLKNLGGAFLGQEAYRGQAPQSRRRRTSWMESLKEAMTALPPDSPRQRQRVSLWEEEAMQHAESMHVQRAASLTLAKRVSGEAAVCRYRLRLLMTSPPMASLVSLLVLANIALIGVEIDVSWHYSQNAFPPVFRYLDKAFAIFFAFEVMLTILGLGCHAYFLGPDRGWNCFDFLITLLSLVQVMVDWITAGSFFDLDGVKMLRLLRLARIARGMKLIPFVSALRNIVTGILSTLRLLVWAMVLLVGIFLFFALALTQLVVDTCRFDAISLTGDPDALPECANRSMSMYWSTVPESMLTLFLVISDGVSWREVLQPLREIHWIAMVLLIVFVVITQFAVLNVFIGVFCNAAIETAAKSREALLDSYVEHQEYITSNMKEMFQELDIHASNEITFAQFEQGLSDIRMRSFLASLDIATNDAWRIFSLLDADQNGLLHVDEFVEGCLHLRGQAKAIHIASLAFEGRKHDARIKNLQKDVSDIDRRLRDFLRASVLCPVKAVKEDFPKQRSSKSVLRL